MIHQLVQQRESARRLRVRFERARKTCDGGRHVRFRQSDFTERSQCFKISGVVLQRCREIGDGLVRLLGPRGGHAQQPLESGLVRIRDCKRQQRLLRFLNMTLP